QLEFLVSNIQWFNKADPSAATCYYRNSTGLNASAELLTYNSAFVSDWNSGINGWSNEDTLGYGSAEYGRKVMSTYFDDPANYTDTSYKTGLVKPFQYIGNGGNGDDGSGNELTNEWNGKITLAGKDSLAKRTDTSSAETYANFVFEKGVYKQNTTYGYYGGEEVYSYYNIGVSTCDKGAVRYFAENFLNKTLDVQYNEDGTIKSIEATGDIQSGLYSVSSYREYLDAIAEAYWFVENTHNTTYQNNTLEYSTAYNADGTPIFDVSISGSDIFQTGTTNTDPVQAEIIYNVITAYNNLFEKENYTSAENDYADAVQTLEVAIADGNYTSESLDNLQNVLDDAAQYFDYYTDSSDTQGKSDYWRYAELTGSEYKELKTLIDAYTSALMPIVDTTQLEPVIEEKAPVRDSGIYIDDVQTYTMASWLALDKELSLSEQLVADSADAPRLIAGPVETVEFQGVTYEYQPVPEDIEANYTDLQIDVYAEDEILLPMELTPVDDPSTYESFDNVVEIVTTLDRNKFTDEGLAKLDALVEQLNEGVDNSASVDESLKNKYVYASADNVARYEAVLGVDLTGQKLRMTSTNETDPLTAALLELVNTLNADFVKMFTAQLNVQKEGDSASLGTTTITLPYGEMFNLDISDILTSNGIDSDTATVVNWSATLYDGTSVDYNVDTASFTTDPTGSQKVAAVSGTLLQRKADTNVAILATITNDTEALTKTTVKIYDVYNRLVDVEYVAEAEIPAQGIVTTLTLNGNDIQAKVIPFYNFSGWTVSAVVDGVVTVKPNYSAEPTYTFVIPEGAVLTGGTELAEANSYQALYDTPLTIARGSIVNFFAWAVKTADGKYQIASYSQTYSFFACADEEYVPITKLGNVFYVGVGDDKTALDPLLIENALPENSLADISDSDYILTKLLNKDPFVAIQNTSMTNSNTKARVYVRVTEGSSSSLTGYGVVYKAGAVTSNDGFTSGEAGVYTRPVDNMLDSGQFVVTLTKSTGFTKSVSFRAYVTYDFSYTFISSTTGTTETAQISAIDYTDYAIAEL
ncbi:MAG: hypothetical protein ACI4IQ_07245, partial [Eubacterium sp.]